MSPTYVFLLCTSAGVSILSELRCSVVSVDLQILSRSKLERVCHSDNTGGPALRSLIDPGGTSLKDVWEFGFLSIRGALLPPRTCDALATGIQVWGPDQDLIQPQRAPGDHYLINELRLETPCHPTKPENFPSPRIFDCD